MSGLPLPALPAVPDWLAAWPWAEAAVIGFGFVWGAMLGSFINVVVHRIPLGESVVRERSRCPACREPIRAADNLPVVGWLKLRGRCRTCAAPISRVYPLVEALAGAIVATLAAAELAGGGRWLPHAAAGFQPGIDRLLRGDWQLMLTFCLHAGCVLMVLCWALLDRTGWRPSPLSLAGALGIGLSLVFLVVSVARVACPPGLLPSAAPWPAATPAIQGLASSLAGAACGGLLGRAGNSAAVRGGLPLLGGLMGWQALVVVTAATAVATGILRGIRPFRYDDEFCRGDFGLLLAAIATAALAGLGPLTTLWQQLWSSLHAVGGGLAGVG